LATKPRRVKAKLFHPFGRSNPRVCCALRPGKAVETKPFGRAPSVGELFESAKPPVRQLADFVALQRSHSADDAAGRASFLGEHAVHAGESWVEVVNFVPMERGQRVVSAAERLTSTSCCAGLRI